MSTPIAMCTHGGDCPVPGHPNALHGEVNYPPFGRELADEKIPCRIMNSTWKCLDCPDRWESTTDASPQAERHFHKTGHRVNGEAEIRLRLLPASQVLRV